MALRRLCTEETSQPPESPQTAPARRATGVGTNVQVNLDDPRGSIQNEVTIAECGGRLVAAWNDSVTESSVGFAYSTNQGSSWIDGGPLAHPPDGFAAGDPVLAVDRFCNFYLTTLAFDFNLNEIYVGVSKSTDGGRTFGAPVRAGGPTVAGFQDKPWIAADSTGGPHDGNVYICWGEFGQVVAPSFARSTDGGITFEPAQALAPPDRPIGTLCQTAVGSQGEVYVAWLEFFPRRIHVRRSDDGGATFRPESVATLAQQPGHLGKCGDAFDPGFFTTRPVMNGFIRNDVISSLAVDRQNGHVYVVWNDGRFDEGDILISRSTDRGEHWSAPLKVNDDATDNDQFMPAVAVNPDGVVKVMWYDRRLDPENTSVDVFSAVSLDGGTTFEPNERITDVSFGLPPDLDMAICYMGDYNGLVGTGTAFHLGWGDNRNPDADGFPQPDVFTEAKAAPSPPISTPTPPTPVTPTPTPTLTPSIGLAHNIAVTQLSVSVEASVDVSVGPVSVPVSLTVENQGNHAEGNPAVLADGVLSALVMFGLPQGCLPRTGDGAAGTFIVAVEASDLGQGESAVTIDRVIELTCGKGVASGDYEISWVGVATTSNHGDILGVPPVVNDDDPSDNIMLAMQTLHVSNPGDSDGDGCTNDQEVGEAARSGGLRDPKHFWDFFDVWTGSPSVRDRSVNIADIGAVVARFGAFRQPPPTEAEALAEAITLPPPAPAYHTSYDRGGPIPGLELWNLRPPDGDVNIIDVGAVVAQFGHSCV